METTSDIAACITRNLTRYFQDLDGQVPCNVYEMVLLQVEKPLLIKVLEQCGGNRSQAARMLGLNRNTLRKKLLQHGLDE